VTTNVQFSGTERVTVGLKLTGVLKVRVLLLLFLLRMLRHRNKRKGQCSASEPMEADRPGRVGGANTIREETGRKKVSRKKRSKECKGGSRMMHRQIIQREIREEKVVEKVCSGKVRVGWRRAGAWFIVYAESECSAVHRQGSRTSNKSLRALCLALQIFTP